MIVGRRSERLVSPDEPDVRRNDSLGLGREPCARVSRRLGRRAALRLKQRVDPGELHKADAGLESAGPVPACIRRVVLHPVIEPVETLGGGRAVTQDVSSHRESNQLVPATELPYELDVRAVRQPPVIEAERRRVGCEIGTAQVVLVPARRVVDAEFDLAECPPSARKDPLHVSCQRLSQDRRCLIRVRELRVCARPVQRSGAPPSRCTSVGELPDLLSRMQCDFERSHRSQAMPIPLVPRHGSREGE